MNLATDKQRPLAPTHTAVVRDFELDEGLVAALEALATTEGCTLFVVLLATYEAFLHRCCLQDDVSIGVPVSLRDRAELKRMLGPFINTVVFRSQLPPNSTFREHLLRTRDTVKAGLPGTKHVPFEDVVNALTHDDRASRRQGLFQTLFNFLRTATSSHLGLAGVAVSPFGSQAALERFDLSLEIYRQEVGVHGWLSFSADLFSDLAADRLVGQWLIFLRAIAEKPDAAASRRCR